MNKNNPYERLKADEKTHSWWQTILDDPRFSAVVEAAKHQLEVTPPKFPGVDAMQAFALLHAAQIGGQTFLTTLEGLGSATFIAERFSAGQAQEAARLTHPSQAGTGYGRHSPPPPEILPESTPSANG